MITPSVPSEPTKSRVRSYPAEDFRARRAEAYIGDHWHTFDARHNCRRIGRVLIARGRDAADVPITMTFGKSCLPKFSVTTEELDQIGTEELTDFSETIAFPARDQKTFSQYAFRTNEEIPSPS